MPHRKQYHPAMTSAEIERVIRSGLEYRKALLDGTKDLRPFNDPMYALLHDAMDSVGRTLETVSGRTMDPRAPDMGLLAPPGGTRPPWEV
jgi:hypothetical protein